MGVENPTPKELAEMRRELQGIAASLDEEGHHRAATMADNAANGSRKDVIRAYKNINRADPTYTGSTGPSGGGADYRVERSSAITGIALAGALGAGMIGLVGEARAANPVTPDMLRSPRPVEQVAPTTLPKKGVLVDLSQAITPSLPRAIAPQNRRVR